MSIDYCITDTSFVSEISNSVLSSTHLYKGTCDSRSLMYNTNIFRARQVTLRHHSIRDITARTIIPYYNRLAPVKKEIPKPNLTHYQLVWGLYIALHIINFCGAFTSPYT